MTEAYEKFKASRPRVGQTVLCKGENVGRVSRVEGALCWLNDDPNTVFIWCFRDGLNGFHDWPTKNRLYPIARGAF